MLRLSSIPCRRAAHRPLLCLWLNDLSRRGGRLFFGENVKAENSKACTKCGVVKPLSEFYNRRPQLHLKDSHCKTCVLKSRRLFRLQNLAKKRAADRAYHFTHRQQRLSYLKQYQQEHLSIRVSKDKERYHSDTWFRLRSILSHRIRTALKRNSKYGSTAELVGCSIDALREYLQSQFYGGMSWDDFLAGRVHIDHKIPCFSFDLSNLEEQRKCFHFSNLQPLWAADNIAKGRKISVEV
jgi:hypothetical protein